MIFSIKFISLLTAGITNLISFGPWVPQPADYTTHTKFVYEDRYEDDLANQMIVTKDDMKVLIDHYVAIHPDSSFSGMEMAFIEASNETGMDPLFFFSLAGIESGWGTSLIHKELNNPYSIGMYGDGVHNGFSLGESFYDGIVNGAVYIFENYYEKGQTTLYSMNHVEYHSYCAGNSSWEEMIDREMKYLRELLIEHYSEIK